MKDVFDLIEKAAEKLLKRAHRLERLILTVAMKRLVKELEADSPGALAFLQETVRTMAAESKARPVAKFLAGVVGLDLEEADGDVQTLKPERIQ